MFHRALLIPSDLQRSNRGTLGRRKELPWSDKNRHVVRYDKERSCEQCNEVEGRTRCDFLLGHHDRFQSIHPSIHSPCSKPCAFSQETCPACSLESLSLSVIPYCSEDGLRIACNLLPLQLCQQPGQAPQCSCEHLKSFLIYFEK